MSERNRRCDWRDCAEPASVHAICYPHCEGGGDETTAWHVNFCGAHLPEAREEYEMVVEVGFGEPCSDYCPARRR